MIRATGLTKHFGDTVAVDGLTFAIRPGRVTGFLGPNGAGKSTTMRMILGLDRPTAGTVTVGGRAYADLAAPMREVGALLEGQAVEGVRSARSHLHWLARAGGLPRSRADGLLEQVGLGDVADKKIRGFSLGMSQRLGIAAALLGDPPVLLFDEPVNGLDVEGIGWVRTMLRGLAAEGRTVVVSSHLMAEMENTADHVLVIGRGRLVADTTTEELTAQGAGAHVRVVSPERDRLQRALEAAGASVTRAEDDGALAVVGLDNVRVGELAADEGITVHELTPKRATLEATFMELTHDDVEYRTAPAPGAAPAGEDR